MLQGEHSAILLTIIELTFVMKILVLSNFELLFYTGFTVSYFISYVVQLYPSLHLYTQKFFHVIKMFLYSIQRYFRFEKIGLLQLIKVGNSIWLKF